MRIICHFALAGLAALALCTLASAQATSPATNTLTVQSGVIRLPGGKEAKSAPIAAGTRIWIRADDAAPGKAFDRWTGDTKGVGNPADDNTLLTMPAGDVTLTATYKEYKAIRVACVGDTTTDLTNYPKPLGKLFATDQERDKSRPTYDVRNYGVPDTLVVQGDKPYVKTAKFQAAKAFQPNIVVLMFGTQDTQRGPNFNKVATFVDEYKKLIGEFAGLPSKPKIFLCIPPPVYGKGQWGINNENLTGVIIPHIKEVAKDLDLPLIDLYTPLDNKPEWFPDNVHPRGDSAKVIAEAVHQAITGAPSSQPAPPKNP